MMSHGFFKRNNAIVKNRSGLGMNNLNLILCIQALTYNDAHWKHTVLEICNVVS